MPLRTHRSELYEKLGWMTVSQLAVYQTLLTMKRIKTTREPEYLYEKLSQENIRGHIVIPNTRLSIAKKSFCWRAAEWWNKIPQDIRTLDLPKFKMELKDWIFRSVERFPD